MMRQAVFSLSLSHSKYFNFHSLPYRRYRCETIFFTFSETDFIARGTKCPRERQRDTFSFYVVVTYKIFVELIRWGSCAKSRYPVRVEILGKKNSCSVCGPTVTCYFGLKFVARSSDFCRDRETTRRIDATYCLH